MQSFPSAFSTFMVIKPKRLSFGVDGRRRRRLFSDMPPQVDGVRDGIKGGGERGRRNGDAFRILFLPSPSSACQVTDLLPRLPPQGTSSRARPAPALGVGSLREWLSWSGLCDWASATVRIPQACLQVPLLCRGRGIYVYVCVYVCIYTIWLSLFYELFFFFFFLNS